MRAEPQDAPYNPDPKILAIQSWLGDPVQAANFPQAQLRFRNRRWDRAVGLAPLSDAEWISHFGRFSPLPDNLPEPLALRYHGHQFRAYNPDIGDGRGFLFAQIRDASGRLLDCGTKGSGVTPYSRTADGRLTLKGAVREILATEMLEALGVYTSKTFSVIETGEELWRGDEPSPTRSAVLVRLSHGHIRIGTFQRLYALKERDHLAQLVDYCLAQYPGPLPPEDAPGRDQPPVILLHQVVERLADQAASYMVAGFVHGVLNTDNMNITGESFDYGPWRWMPSWDPNFTAAYFDHEKLYAFARQPETFLWNCAQLANALHELTDVPNLVAALDRFGSLYEQALARRFAWRLGVQPANPDKGIDRDLALVKEGQRIMQEHKIGPDEFFFTHRGGRSAQGSLAAALEGRKMLDSNHEYWAGAYPQTMLIDEVESIWDAIDQHDDWSMLGQKLVEVQRMGHGHGEAPQPAGQIFETL